MKILVIDDDVLSLKAICQLLADSSYTVEALSNPAEAWQQLINHPADYAVVLTDRMMLGIDALELLSRAKQFPALHSLPIIVLTGEADDEERAAVMEAGAFAFIYKPVEKAQLWEVIAKAISVHSHQ